MRFSSILILLLSSSLLFGYGAKEEQMRKLSLSEGHVAIKPIVPSKPTITQYTIKVEPL